MLVVYVQFTVIVMQWKMHRFILLLDNKTSLFRYGDDEALDMDEDRSPVFLEQVMQY
jgi:hypothetical protein